MSCHHERSLKVLTKDKGLIVPVAESIYLNCTTATVFTLNLIGHVKFMKLFHPDSYVATYLTLMMLSYCYDDMVPPSCRI